MKTKKVNQNYFSSNAFLRKFRKNHLFLFIMVSVICCIDISAQKPGPTINIYGTKFTYPLIEKWISEYSKVNQDVRFKLIKNPDQNERIDLRVTAHTPGKNEINASETLVKVGRYALLPITNEKNRGLSKQLKNGIGQDWLKEIFLKKENEWDSESKNKPSFIITVYTKTPQSCSAIAFANYLGKPVTDLTGIIIAGDDKYLTSSVLKDSTGITYNNLGHIYDLNNRRPLSGIKIVPIDINDNGKLEREEQIYDDLDQVISLLENTTNKTIPMDYVGFIYNSDNETFEITDFLNWVATNGQQYNHLYGFLTESNKNNNALSQK